jgi:hypothetical protein
MIMRLYNGMNKDRNLEALARMQMRSACGLLLLSFSGLLAQTASADDL